MHIVEIIRNRRMTQNFPSHGLQVPSDSKNLSKTIMLTKNQSPCDSSHSHQRTIQTLIILIYTKICVILGAITMNFFKFLKNGIFSKNQFV